MKKSVIKPRTRNFREVELLIWLLIILALSVIGFTVYTKKQKSYEVHKIFVSDVDGLIVGSPVNLMGVPVGHVTKLKFVRDDEIYIRFIIKDKSIKLPKGTIANIEFSGLGGSKSIELYPPDKEYVKEFGLDGDNYVIVAKTKRLHDSCGLLYEMFSKLDAIFDKVAYFGQELQKSNIDSATLEVQGDINKFLEFSNSWVDNIQKKVNDYIINIDKNNKECRGTNNE